MASNRQFMSCDSVHFCRKYRQKILVKVSRSEEKPGDIRSLRGKKLCRERFDRQLQTSRFLRVADIQAVADEDRVVPGFAFEGFEGASSVCCAGSAFSSTISPVSLVISRRSESTMSSTWPFP
jgi:hypothetical protein